MIWPLPAKRINGIGPKAAARLERLGIATIGELAYADARKLEAVFGAGYARWMIDAANGRDERPVVTESEPRSISRETTFERDLSATRDRAELSRIFTWLCERVADDLARKGYAGRTIGVKLRFDDFATVTRDHTVDEPTQDATAIRRAAGECLKRVPLAAAHPPARRAHRAPGAGRAGVRPCSRIEQGLTPTATLARRGRFAL